MELCELGTADGPSVMPFAAGTGEAVGDVVGGAVLVVLVGLEEDTGESDAF